jgi:hypothetical protein
MNFEEILEEIKKVYGSDVSEFAYSSGVHIPNVGRFEEIDQIGGESEGSHWHSVKYFKDHDVYLKVTGYYSSYNGTDFDDGWDSCEQVTPQEKTITVYE